MVPVIFHSSLQTCMFICSKWAGCLTSSLVWPLASVLTRTRQITVIAQGQVVSRGCVRSMQRVCKQKVCKEYAESMQRYTESMQRVCRVHRVCRGSIKMQTMV